MKYRTLVVRIVGVAISFMWAAAAFGKFKDMEIFQLHVGQSPLLQGFGEAVRWITPLSEILIAITLNYKNLNQIGFYATVFMLSLFNAYIVTILSFRYYIPCACSGFAANLSWEEHIVFNFLFMALAIAGIFLNDKRGKRHIESSNTIQTSPKLLRNRVWLPRKK